MRYKTLVVNSIGDMVTTNRYLYWLKFFIPRLKI